MKTRDDWVDARNSMVDTQLRGRGIRDERVLSAMQQVPRHLFVSTELQAQAYDDCPLPIGFGQTISQPYMVARMLELCALEGLERVLEVGAGSAYVAALLQCLAKEVFVVEIIPELCAAAQARLKELGLGGVVMDCRDGTQGFANYAPYHVIVVSAGAPQMPVLLIDQLAEGGRLVVPVGQRENQVLTRITRKGDSYEILHDVSCRFVDLLGRYGWGAKASPQA